jgi:hypothetical protein
LSGIGVEGTSLSSRAAPAAALAYAAALMAAALLAFVINRKR